MASTKSFTSQLVILFLIAVALGKKFNNLKTSKVEKLCNYINMLPSAIAQMLKIENKIKLIAQILKMLAYIFLRKRAFISHCSRGRIETKRNSYIHAEGFAAGEK